MASSSSSHPMKYQVFLSFRGEDTRLNFTTHLLEALKNEGLDVFFDEEKLEKGKQLSPELTQAIKASNISIIVLSQDYASSKSCLAELSDIMHRKVTQGQVVLPIFYHVNPSDVKDVGGSFKTSFADHEAEGLLHVKQWKAAFTQVGHLKKWWHIEDTFNRPETEYIKDIVEYVIQKLLKHQIFLSFKPEDTGLNFTGHLLKALENKGINVLSENETLSHKYQAIAASHLSIIVISVDFASSASCLAEVSDIMSCKDKDSKAQIVLPIFYHVDPSHVRNIEKSFKTSFEEHESKRPVDAEVKRWKLDFAEVGKLKGWHIEGGKFDRSDSEYIKDIVGYCIEKLNSKSISVSEGLVGIDDQIEMILRLIEEEENRVIGLWGMGGSGKTTLAEAVYNEISPSPKFDSCCFVQNVREKIEKQGMESLRKFLLSRLLNSVTCVDTPSIGSTFTQQRLENIRVIVVLDDVNDSDQIVDMGIKHFGPGSKIIVTSRDKQELENGGADKIHKVEMLNENNSLLLFSTFAFKQMNPAVEFQYLSNKFVTYAQGSPLALKVLGSRLYKKSRQVWESELVKLTEYPNPKVLQVLRINFDGLDDELEKKIFLDVAIFYKGEPRGIVEAILSSYYGEGALSGISSLLDKCLLESVSHRHHFEAEPCECISMHDLLEELGKEIVRQESKDPFQRSRLWAPKDVFQVLQDNKGTGSIEGIKLEKSKGIEDRRLCPTVFQNMLNLRHINLNVIWEKQVDQVDIVSLPDELRYIKWGYFPFKSLSSSFNPTHLFVLKIHDSEIEQLWDDGDVQDLVNLREIDVSRCMCLRKIPDLSRAINLKTLKLYGCAKLEKIPDLSRATNLKTLNCGGCISLAELPCLSHLASLQKLNLSGCHKIKKIPDLSGALNLKVLNCCWCESLVELPCLNHLTSLEGLHLCSCTKLSQIPSLKHLTSLEELMLDKCRSLKKFPEIPNHFSKLCLLLTGIEEVPDSIEHLVGLETLKLQASMVERVSSNISKLKSLHHLDLIGCLITKFPEIPRSLKELDLSWSYNIEGLSLSYKSNVGDCSSTQRLQCNIGLSGLKEIPTTDVPSPILRLESLHVVMCRKLQFLSELPPYLQNLDARDCELLEEVSFTDENLYQFDSLAYADHDKFFMLFSNCFRLNQDSVDNIEANAMLKIGSLAEKWARENAHGRPKELICCFPRNEISANKFEYQSENSWISLKISPNECGGSRFLAFSIYIVVDHTSFRGDDEYRDRCICEYKLTTTGGESEKFESEWYLWRRPKEIVLGKYCNIKERGNHVLILFSEDMVKKDKNYEEASFQFYFNGWKVKKIGVHVLYVNEEHSPKPGIA